MQKRTYRQRYTAPPEERFWFHVNRDGPPPPRHPELGNCWLWEGGRSSGEGRYGGFTPFPRVHVGAHCYSFELTHGPIPEGLVVDHLCSVPLCVRPSHLEAVSQPENVKRGAVYRTHCPQGHPYDEANTAYTSSGWRKCKACENERALARYYARKAADPSFHPALSTAAINAAKTTCPQGHPYVVRPNGQRRCPTCEREAARRKRAQTPRK